MATYVGNALFAHARQGCYLCLRGDSLVDIGVDIVGEGALVLCKGCVAEAAEAAGLTFNRARIRELETALLDKQNALTLAVAREAAFAAALEATTAGPGPVLCSATTKAGAPCKAQAAHVGQLCNAHKDLS